MIQKNNTDCYTDDWKRTEPDHVVYLPKTTSVSLSSRLKVVITS